METSDKCVEKDNEKKEIGGRSERRYEWISRQGERQGKRMRERVRYMWRKDISKEYSAQQDQITLEPCYGMRIPKGGRNDRERNSVRRWNKSERNGAAYEERGREKIKLT